jgi:hypothetical protein
MVTEAAIDGIKDFLKQKPSLSKILEYVENEAQTIASKISREQVGEKLVH